jgi:hypothetical protein
MQLRSVIACGRALALLALAAAATGCTWVGWGSYPQASGDGVDRYRAYLKEHHLEPYQKKVHPYPFHEPIADADLTTVVTTPELTLLVELEGYTESVVLWGILVPLLPEPGRTRPDERLRITIHVAHAAQGALFQAHTLRLRTSGGEYAARWVHLYRPKSGTEVDPPEPIAVEAHDGLHYEFDVVAPHEPFTLEIAGIPALQFEPETVWNGGWVNTR